MQLCTCHQPLPPDTEPGASVHLQDFSSSCLSIPWDQNSILCSTLWKDAPHCHQSFVYVFVCSVLLSLRFYSLVTQSGIGKQLGRGKGKVKLCRNFCLFIWSCRAWTFINVQTCRKTRLVCEQVAAGNGGFSTKRAVNVNIESLS